MDNTNITAYLRIMGDYFDIQEITDTLNILPTETWYMGEPIRKTGHNYKYTAWIYSTDVMETLDIKDPIKKLEELFYSKVNKIIFLKDKYDLDISIDFKIVIESNEPPAIYFEPQFIEFVERIGARLDIDTYIN